MPSGSYIQAYVRCPFYRSDNGADRIICEGLVPGSQLQSYFKRNRDYRLQTEIFCCRHYDHCEIYAALLKKYEEEDE